MPPVATGGECPDTMCSIEMPLPVRFTCSLVTWLHTPPALSEPYPASTLVAPRYVLPLHRLTEYARVESCRITPHSDWWFFPIVSLSIPFQPRHCAERCSLKRSLTLGERVPLVSRLVELKRIAKTTPSRRLEGVPKSIAYTICTRSRT